MEKGLNGFKKSESPATPAKPQQKYELLKVDGLFGQTSIKMEQRMLNAEIDANLEVDGFEGLETNKARQRYINNWIRKQNY